MPPKRLAQLSASEDSTSGCPWFHIGESGYPSVLLDLVKPPPVVWLRGQSSLLSKPALAVVGSRRCTPYGRHVATAIGRGVGERGAALVSGGAHGIDTAAHRGALDVAGATIAVLAQGLDIRSSGDAGALHERILKGGGLLVSERMPTEPATRWAFPRRNRLIAALAPATVVVEAGRRSGALYTATAALELGRDVFAVPGRIDAPASQGSNQLLLQGATPLVQSDQVLRGLELHGSHQARLRAVLPGTLPSLSRRSRLPVREVLALLSAWELTQQVVLLPSGVYELYS